jgi:hypothetical protein
MTYLQVTELCPLLLILCPQNNFNRFQPRALAAKAEEESKPYKNQPRLETLHLDASMNVLHLSVRNNKAEARLQIAQHIRSDAGGIMTSQTGACLRWKRRETTRSTRKR